MVTAAQIADALGGILGPVNMRFRFEQRDHNYALQADLSDAVRPGGDLVVDPDRAIVWTATLEIIPERLPAAFDLTTDHIAIVAEVLVDGSFEEFPLGLYHLDVARKRTIEGGDQLLQLNASGGSVHLSATTDAPYSIASGANYIVEATTILTNLGLASALPAVAKTLPVTQGWAPATEWRKILNALMAGINHYPVYPDGEGSFTTKEQIDPATEAPDLITSTEQEPKIISAPEGDNSSFEQFDDVARFHNRAVVLIDHPDRTPGFELRENNDPASPISTVSLGRDLEKQIPGGLTADAATAGELCEFFLREQASRAEKAVLRTFFDPRRGPRETYQLTIETLEVLTLWRVLRWKMELDTGGRMEHTIGRAQSINITEPA